MTTTTITPINAHLNIFPALTAEPEGTVVIILVLVVGINVVCVLLGQVNISVYSPGYLLRGG